MKSSSKLPRMLVHTLLKNVITFTRESLEMSTNTRDGDGKAWVKRDAINNLWEIV